MGSSFIFSRAFFFKGFKTRHKWRLFEPEMDCLHHCFVEKNVHHLCRDC
jgi:hypothetical protein